MGEEPEKTFAGSSTQMELENEVYKVKLDTELLNSFDTDRHHGSSDVPSVDPENSMADAASPKMHEDRTVWDVISLIRSIDSENTARPSTTNQKSAEDLPLENILQEKSVQVESPGEEEYQRNVAPLGTLCGLGGAPNDHKKGNHRVWSPSPFTQSKCATMQTLSNIWKKQQPFLAQFEGFKCFDIYEAQKKRQKTLLLKSQPGYVEKMRMKRSRIASEMGTARTAGSSSSSSTFLAAAAAAATAASVHSPKGGASTHEGADQNRRKERNEMKRHQGDEEKRACPLALVLDGIEPKRRKKAKDVEASSQYCEVVMKNPTNMVSLFDAVNQNSEARKEWYHAVARVSTPKARLSSTGQSSFPSSTDHGVHTGGQEGGKKDGQNGVVENVRENGNNPWRRPLMRRRSNDTTLKASGSMRSAAPMSQPQNDEEMDQKIARERGIQGSQQAIATSEVTLARGLKSDTNASALEARENATSTTKKHPEICHTTASEAKKSSKAVVRNPHTTTGAPDCVTSSGHHLSRNPYEIRAPTHIKCPLTLRAGERSTSLVSKVSEWPKAPTPHVVFSEVPVNPACGPRKPSLGDRVQQVLDGSTDDASGTVAAILQSSVAFASEKANAVAAADISTSKTLLRVPENKELRVKDKQARPIACTVLTRRESCDSNAADSHTRGEKRETTAACPAPKRTTSSREDASLSSAHMPEKEGKHREEPAARKCQKMDTNEGAVREETNAERGKPEVSEKSDSNEAISPRVRGRAASRSKGREDDVMSASSGASRDRSQSSESSASTRTKRHRRLDRHDSYSEQEDEDEHSRGSKYAWEKESVPSRASSPRQRSDSRRQRQRRNRSESMNNSRHSRSRHSRSRHSRSRHSRNRHSRNRHSRSRHSRSRHSRNRHSRSRHSRSRHSRSRHSRSRHSRSRRQTPRRLRRPRYSFSRSDSDSTRDASLSRHRHQRRNRSSRSRSYRSYRRSKRPSSNSSSRDSSAEYIKAREEAKKARRAKFVNWDKKPDNAATESVIGVDGINDVHPGGRKTRDLFVTQIPSGGVALVPQLVTFFAAMFLRLPAYEERYKLNGALPTARVTMSPCETYAFVGFLNDELASTALKFDGALFLGRPIKIKRTQTYVKPPLGDCPPLNVSSLRKHHFLGPEGEDMTQIIKKQRELYVGNIGPTVTAEMLLNTFTAGLTGIPQHKSFIGPPVEGVKMMEKFAFITFQSPAVTTVAMEMFNQYWLEMSALRIRRPTGYRGDVVIDILTSVDEDYELSTSQAKARGICAAASFMQGDAASFMRGDAASFIQGDAASFMRGDSENQQNEPQEIPKRKR